MPKQLTILTTYPLWDEPVIRNRLQPVIEESLHQGLSIVLLSPDSRPWVPNSKGGFHHELVGSYTVRSRNFLIRALQEISSSLAIILRSRRFRDGAVMVTIPSMFLLIFSHFLAHKHRIVDIRDLSWEYLSGSRLKSIGKKILSKLARARLKDFQAILTVNSNQKLVLNERYGVENAKLISNGISKAQYLAINGAKCKPNKKPTVTYIGNVGLAQQLGTLVLVAARHPQIQFNIVGAGNDLPRIETLAASVGAVNVCFWGRCDWQEIPAIYARSNILYAQITEEYSSAFPSKLYEYLATGKFIIFGGNGFAADQLLAFENNIIVAPGDVATLDAALHKVINQGLHEKQSEKNQKAIYEQYLREHQAQKLLTLVFDQM